jgi:hypothetical protein
MKPDDIFDQEPPPGLVARIARQGEPRLAALREREARRRRQRSLFALCSLGTVAAIALLVLGHTPAPAPAPRAGEGGVADLEMFEHFPLLQNLPNLKSRKLLDTAAELKRWRAKRKS